MTTPTREQLLAEQIAQMRAQHPMLPDSYWEDVERERRLQWQLADLRNGVAELVGRYGWHVEQNPDNTLLAELVAALDKLTGVDHV